MNTVLLPAELDELKTHAERASKARQEGMQLLHDRDTNEYFATSKSKPGTLHRVTLFSCDCLGFVRHGHCRHHSALVVAHLLQELSTGPDPITRRTQNCERMAAPTSQPATPDRRDIHDAATGALIGYVVVKEWSVEAWAFSAWDGSPDCLWQGSWTTQDYQDRAEQRIRERFFRTHIAAPAGAPLVVMIGEGEGEDEVRTPQGRLVGYVRAAQNGIEAWGYGADGTLLILSNCAEREDAAQTVWTHYQRRGWAGPQIDRHAA